MIRRFPWLKFAKFRLYSILAIAFVAGGAWFAYANAQSPEALTASQQEATNDTVNKVPVLSIPAEQPLASEDNALTPTGSESTNSTPTTTAPAVSTDSPKQNAPAAAAPMPNAPVCSRNMTDFSKDYNNRVSKERRLLDNTLSSLLVGFNISSQYVRDYNSKILSIFNQFSSEAAKSSCAFPVPKPVALPGSYLPL